MTRLPRQCGTLIAVVECLGLNEMQDNTNLSNLGTVLSVRGSVVDMRFNAALPPIHSLLQAMEGKVAVEVLAQLDSQRIRGIA